MCDVKEPDAGAGWRIRGSRSVETPKRAPPAWRWTAPGSRRDVRRAAPPRPVSGFTLLELLVVISVVGLLAGLLLPAVQQAREAARRTECGDRLHNLALGLHAYEARRRCLPPGSLTHYFEGPPASGWGWGAFILPDVEQTPLFQAVDFQKHTAVGSNREVIARPTPLFVCPSDPAPERARVSLAPHPHVDVAHGNYLGSKGVLGEMSAVRFAEITDGLFATLLLGERVYVPHAVHAGDAYTSAWCGVIAERDLFVDNSVPHTQADAAIGINASFTLPGSFASRHPGGSQFAMADGTARFLSENMSGTVFAALGTKDGGEPVGF